MALNDKKLQRLDQLLAAFDTGAVQPDELIQAIDAVIAIIDQNGKTLVDKILENKSASDEDISALRSELAKTKTNLETVISNVKDSSSANVDKVRAALLTEIKRVESLIPELPPETDLSEVFGEIESQKELLANLSILIVGENIRNALESLQGDERLDVSAIKGIDKLIADIKLIGGEQKSFGVRLLKYLADVNIDGITNGQTLVWDSATGKFIPGTGSGGASTFIDLTDTPATYTGQAGKTVTVKGTEDGLEFTTPAGGGDMLASTYDPANKAEQVLTISDATTTTTADKLVLRDTNANVFANNVFTNLTSTVSAGGTTVLTVASARVQRLTGSSSQTFQLPDATTLPLSSIFEFDNNSSSSLIITNAGAVTQYTVPAGGAVLCIVTSIGTANGAWQFHALTPGSVTWGSGITGLVMNSVLTTSPSVGSGASSAAAPSFIPQRGANTTGFGGDGTKLFASIAGGAALTVETAGTTAPKFTATTDNAYDATAWNGSLRLVTENAIRDKIESLVDGGITRTITSISTPTTAGASVSVDYVYFVTNTTLTLPTAVGNTNRYTVKCISGTCVVDGAGAETIDGTSDITIQVEDSVDLISNNTEFKVV